MMSYHSGCWNLSLQQNADLRQLKIPEVLFYSVHRVVTFMLRHERVKIKAIAGQKLSWFLEMGMEK